jgi:hypothetical protein
MESVGAGVLARAASLFLLTTHAAHARRSGITARGRCDDPLSGLALLPASHEVPGFAELFVFSSGHRKVWKEGKRGGRREVVHWDDVPCISRHDVDRENIDLLRCVWPLCWYSGRPVTGAHPVRQPVSVLAGVHLHPPKPIARIHDEIVGLTVP